MSEPAVQETMDTFETPKVEETNDAGVKLPENDTSQVHEEIQLDTFENPMESDQPVAKEEPKKEEDSQTKQLEDKEEGPGDEKDEKDGEEEKKDESEEENVEEQQADSEEPKEKVKTIKGSSEHGRVEVPEDTQFRVKIAGKSTPVSIKELTSNYSGKVAWDQKFSELDTERKEFIQQEEKFTHERNQVLQRLGDVIDLIDDPEGTPDAAVSYLLDIAGRNSYDFKKKYFEHMAEEFETYADMDEVERRAYWAEKKVEYLERSSKSSARIQEERRTQEDTLRKVDELRETYGVSEEQYVEGHHELVELGVESPTPQQVVKYAAALPFIAKAEGLVESYDNVFEENEVDYDSVVQGIAEALMSGISEQAVVEELANAYGNSDSKEIDELNGKVWDTSLSKSSKAKAKRKPYEKEDSEKGLEFFDDLDLR